MIVLDCSAAVDMSRGTIEGNALCALMEGNEKVISSDLCQIELASAFGKYVKAGTMEKDEAVILMQDSIEMVDEFVPISENYIEAFHESLRLKHSVFDMLYLTLARRNAAILFTLDAKLADLCEDQGISCVHQIEF